MLHNDDYGKTRPRKRLFTDTQLAKHVDDLGTSTTDSNDLVRGLLQASIARGLDTEMDAHLGYSER